MSDLVSVVIPTRNRLRMLQRAVASVQRQTWENLEIIILDEASTDATPRYLAQLAAADARVQVVRHDTPAGANAARNEGIRLSRGPWVAFLDDDDEWFPEKLEQQVGVLVAHPEAVACSCGFETRYPLGFRRKYIPPQEISYQDLLRLNLYGGASVCLARKAVLNHIGGFDEQLRAAQDWDLWVRLYQQGPVLGHTRVLARYHYYLGNRISRSPQKFNQGLKVFYLKYRSAMTREVQRYHLARICSMLAREESKAPSQRLRYLLMGIKHQHRSIFNPFTFLSLARIGLGALGALFKA